ncbi:hypothetical protein ACWIDW_13330 [Microbacterium sp. NPDC055312]
MTMTTTLVRTGSAFAAAGLLIGMLSACTPEPKPTPKPTKTAAFATDEEAYAAAEETYRAYTDAMNAVDLADPATFNALYRHSIGDFQAADRRTYSALHAEGLRMTGEVRLASFEGTGFDPEEAKASAHVCVDVSDSDVVDGAGQSQVAPDRPSMNSLTVEFRAKGDTMLIARADRDETRSCED